MVSTRGTCAFCGAAGDPVRTPVIDDRCSRALGGHPVVTLDHGSYRSLGRTVAAPTLDPAKFFSPVARAVCDYCANGWVDDIRTRAQPALLALATGRSSTSRTGRDALALVRWARLTAVLAELLDGMPTASSPVHRDALRRGAVPTPPSSIWFFSTSQRLPCRVHLSQAHADPGEHRGVVQVVSIELARLTTLVVLPADGRALELVEHSALPTAFGQPARGDDDELGLLDLARSPHPHRVAVHRLCAATCS